MFNSLNVVNLLPDHSTFKITKSNPIQFVSITKYDFPVTIAKVNLVSFRMDVNNFAKKKEKTEKFVAILLISFAAFHTQSANCISKIVFCIGICHRRHRFYAANAVHEIHFRN